MQSMRISGAARYLGYKSHSQLYKLINDGWLDEHVYVQIPIGQRLLDVEGLQESLRGCVSGGSTVCSQVKRD